MQKYHPIAKTNKINKMNIFFFTVAIVAAVDLLMNKATVHAKEEDFGNHAVTNLIIYLLFIAEMYKINK